MIGSYSSAGAVGVVVGSGTNHFVAMYTSLDLCNYDGVSERAFLALAENLVYQRFGRIAQKPRTRACFVSTLPIVKGPRDLQ
jgi:hypothetical protein